MGAQRHLFMYESNGHFHSNACACAHMYAFAADAAAFSLDVICFLKLLLVCIFRLSCFLLVRSLLARFQRETSTTASQPGAGAHGARRMSGQWGDAVEEEAEGSSGSN